MKLFSISSAAALTLALAACGESQAPIQANAGATAGQPTDEAGGQVYSAAGDVTQVSGDRVTIAHGPVEGIGWPAMTMAFRAPSPEMVQGISVGDPVSFRFREAGGGEYELTSLAKAR